MGQVEKSERIEPAATRYAERFSRVLAYIELNSERALSIEELSGIAAFSRHHFHRQFSGFLGMGTYKYVQFMRMRRASWRLAFRPELSVNEIALATGYEGPEAFARAFRQYAGQSPSEFRNQPDWVEWNSRFRPFIHLRQTHMNTLLAQHPVRVVQFQPTRVALLEHRGSPLALGDSIRKFIAWRRANGLPPAKHATFNIIHNDPDETPAEEFRFDLCVAIDGSVAANTDGVREGLIAGGRCAMLRHTGSDDQLGRSIYRLYAEWLPASGEETRDFPLFMQRVRFFPEVPDGEAVTDIYLPLK
jgi:AraC family transcriptional regulator